MVVPESNQKTLRPNNRAAAIVLGQQDRHMIGFPGVTLQPRAQQSAPGPGVQTDAGGRISREEAARIMFGDAGAAAKMARAKAAPPAPGGDLQQMKVADLRALASERGVSVGSRATKADLVSALGGTPSPAKKTAAQKMTRAKAPTRADLILADDVASIADERMLRGHLGKASLARIQGAGRVLGVDLGGLDKDAAAARLSAWAVDAKPGRIDVGPDPAVAMAERISALDSEPEMVAALQASNPTELRKVAKEAGIRVPAGMRNAEEIRAYIARSLSSFGS
jgi:hypothetical protein